MDLNISLNEEASEHKTTCSVEGDWIVWRCHICEQYERRLNWKTGKMSNKSPSHFTHSGTTSSDRSEFIISSN